MENKKIIIVDKLQNNPEFMNKIEILKKIIKDYNHACDLEILEEAVKQVCSMMEDVNIDEDYLSPENKEILDQAYNEIDYSLERRGKL